MLSHPILCSSTRCCNTSESQADSLAHKSRRQTSVVPNLDTGFKRVTKQYTIMFRRGVCFVVLIAVAQTCGAFNIGKKGAVIHSIEPYRTWGASRHPTGSLAGSHNHPYRSCLPSVAQKRNNFESRALCFSTTCSSHSIEVKLLEPT